MFKTLGFVLLFSFYNHFGSVRNIDKVDRSEMISDSALLAKEHPSPSIVRGFMMKETSDQKDYDDARAWGANVAQIQLRPASYAIRKNMTMWEALPSFIDQLEMEIKKAKQAGLKVVVDLVEPPFPYGPGYADKPAEFWNREDLEETYCRFWTNVSKRLILYKDVIWGYDIHIEPLDRSQLPAVPSQWRPLAMKIVKAIRNVDKDSWIIFEPGPGSLAAGFEGLLPLPDSHIIYSFHFYYPQDEFTHRGVYNLKGISLDSVKKLLNTYPLVINGVLWDKDRLAKILDVVDVFQDRWKVPVYVGEFSVIRWAPEDGAVRWLQDVVDLFEARGWSWSYHAFREWHGWSLEHDQEFWRVGMSSPKSVTYETERSKVIKRAFLKNW